MTRSKPAQSVARSVDGERAADLLRSVRDHELPPCLQSLVTEYRSFEGARPLFIWQWVHRLAPKNTMPVVDTEHRQRVATNKTMLVLFVTILDDLVEKRRDYETFDAITRLVRLRRDDTTPEPIETYGEGVDEEYVAFARDVWTTLVDRLEDAPQYDRYASLFRFDVRQILTAIEYSTLVISSPELATRADLDRYETHNMGMFSYLDIDLMHASADHTESLSLLREAVDAGQRMARIGNWLSTWERELREGDVSSGVVVAALERGVIDPAELPAADGEADVSAEVDRLIDRIVERGLESELLDEWNEEYRRLRALSERTDAVDLGPFVEGTKDVLRYHLASRGYK
ncbi:hypothetical protein [Halobellus rarus]|uniref:Uncharacterized protein n=1 Tax=Halobellus rarus TaxID=1126237 RepID=A0ABD6CHY2_9EURY|nr:hypothetical protein [Halobellus rarus]